MSRTYMLEVHCDADCDQVIRVWHWNALPLAVMSKSKLRKAAWRRVTGNDGEEHYCPAHGQQSQPIWDRYSRRADRARAWEEKVTDGTLARNDN